MQMHTDILDQILEQHHQLAQDCYILRTKHMLNYLFFAHMYQQLKLGSEHYLVTICDQFH